MAMIDLKETKTKSKHMQLNGRDFLRGLTIAVLTGAITVMAGVDDVRQLATPDVWWDALNAAWKPAIAYLAINIKK